MSDFEQQYRNQLMQREIASQQRSAENKKHDKQLQGILNRKHKYLSDFPFVQQYLDRSFPGIDISQVPIYIVSHDDLAKLGICAHGCYYKNKNIILIRKPMTAKFQVNNKFDQVMLSKTKSRITIEDIVVHECIHAISKTANRSTGDFLFAEEEFVFTNCIDFYKSKGMSEEDIVQSVLLPFCINNVMDDRYTMVCIFEKIRITSPKMKPFSEFENSGNSQKYAKYLSLHAQKIVPVIVDFAKELATRMIEIYNEFGRGTKLNSDRSGKHNNRFASIDMESDW